MSRKPKKLPLSLRVLQQPEKKLPLSLRVSQQPEKNFPSPSGCRENLKKLPLSLRERARVRGRGSLLIDFCNTFPSGRGPPGIKARVRLI